MMLARRIGMRWFATPHKPIVQLQSNTIVDPYFYENKTIIARIQNYFQNRSTLTDIERSFKDFKRSKVDERYCAQYNSLVNAINCKNLDQLELYLSPSLTKFFKKAIRNDEDLPYYLQPAHSCSLVQARSYNENMPGIKSTNKWYQLTFRFRLVSGETAYHILERNDKNKHFKFIKFHL